MSSELAPAIIRNEDGAVVRLDTSLIEHPMRVTVMELRDLIVEHHSTIVDLNLSHMSLGNIGLLALAEAINTCDHLEILNISYNYICPSLNQGVYNILTALDNVQIVSEGNGAIVAPAPVVAVPQAPAALDHVINVLEDEGLGDQEAMGEVFEPAAGM